MSESKTREEKEGELEVEKVGKLSGGKLFSRIDGRTNPESPEYILGELAKKLGHGHGSDVRYKVIVYKN